MSSFAAQRAAFKNAALVAPVIKKRQLPNDTVDSVSGPHRQPQRNHSHVSALKKSKGLSHNMAVLAALPKPKSTDNVAMLQKKIVDFLKGRQDVVNTAQDILDAVEIDVLNNPRLMDVLSRNPRLRIENNTFSFKPEYICNTTKDIENLLVNQLEWGNGGVLHSELLDSNPDVGSLLEELTRENRLVCMKVTGKTGRPDYVYFYHHALYDPASLVPISEEYCKDWRSVAKADQVEVNKTIAGTINLGMMATETKPKEVKKAKRKTKIKKVHNTHVTNIVWNE